MNTSETSPLLTAAVAADRKKASQTRSLTTVQQNVLSKLQGLGYHSVFDVIAVSKQRFIRRHDTTLAGRAAAIYDNAVSFSNQVAQRRRRQRLRRVDSRRSSSAGAVTTSSMVPSEVNEGELPSYAQLFPEPWYDFCRPGEVEAIDAPVSYLVDLYKFVQQLDADSTPNAITLDNRRPDIADLLLNSDTTYQEIPELWVVNSVLTTSARRYIDEVLKQADRPVHLVLGETRYPFALPYNLPVNQINLGLAEKDSTRSDIIRQLDRGLPWNMDRAKRDQALLAATLLSPQKMRLLTENSVFAQTQLTLDRLKVSSYTSGSTTETLPDDDLTLHAYVVPTQDDVTGPSALTQTDDPNLSTAAGAYDTLTVTCWDGGKNRSVDLNLRAKNILTYRRIKARMQRFDTQPPYSRQLELSYHAEDNIGITDSILANGPYFGYFTTEARKHESGGEQGFLALTFAVAVAAEGYDEAELMPDAADFFHENYGISMDQLGDLKQITFFGQQTSGSIAEIEQMLAQGDYRPKVSSNVQFSNEIFVNGQTDKLFPDTYHYGARYINVGQPESLTIVKTDIGRQMAATSEYRYDRMNRFLRLQRWLGIPHAQLDLLLIAAMGAEADGNPSLILNRNTLRALGLYRSLNHDYTLEPAAFAAFIHQITLYATSAEIPFFDQVFNDPQLFDTPFMLDDVEFDYTKTHDEEGETDAKTVQQMAAGLSITNETFLALAPLVQSALGLNTNTLTRSSTVVSALYRLVNIPQLFGLTPEDNLLLMPILTAKTGGSDALQLLIQPVIDDANVDTLDIIALLEALVAWMNAAKLSAGQLSLLLNKGQTSIVPTEGMAAFLNTMLDQLQNGALLSEDSFHRPELPLLPGHYTWMGLLEELIRDNGLIEPFPLQWGVSDEKYLRDALETIIEQTRNEIPILDPVLADEEDIVNVLEQIIQQAKSSQENIVATAVANEYGVARELVTLLLRWSGSSVADLGSQLLNGGPFNNLVDIPSTLLNLTYVLLLRVVVIQELNISRALLFLRLAEPAWLSLPAATADLPLDELYLLVSYRDLLTASAYTEEEVQDYLSHANPALAPASSVDDFNFECAGLLADILGWTAGEVSSATAELTAGRATHWLEIDWLRRMQQLSVQTGLSAAPLMQAAKLRTTSAFKDYQSVGEAVIAASKTEGAN